MRTSGSRRGGILLGLLISALMVVCLCIAAGLYIARNVRVETVSRSGAENVSIDTPVGHLDVRAREHFDPASLGVPIYPGAQRIKNGGGATVEWNPRDGQDKGVSVAGAEMFTPDPADKVVEYYRAQLPKWMVVQERHGVVRLELDQGGYKRIIGIHEKADGTHIGVATVGESGAN